MRLNKLLQLIRDNARPENSTVPSIRLEVKDEEAHIYVYDVIDSYWGASAKDLVKALADAGDKKVHMHVNSPGGDVFEGRAMAAAMAAHATAITCHVDGICASAATYLPLAASDVSMTDGGLFMVHNSWTFAMGNKAELRQTADLLDKIDGTIRDSYAAKCKCTAKQATEWMDAETWFTADEAKTAGFIDKVEPSTQKRDTKDQWDLSAYANAPKSMPEPKVVDNTAELVAAQLQRNRNRLRLVAQRHVQSDANPA